MKQLFKLTFDTFNKNLSKLSIVICFVFISTNTKTLAQAFNPGGGGSGTSILCPKSATPTSYNSGVVNITSNTTFAGDVIVTSGTTLNISNTIVKMKTDAKIIIQNGARLNVNNAKITVDCPTEVWGGIEVYGNQINNNVGKVYLTNSTIELAKVGIANTNSSMPASSSFFDGFVEACQSTFIDNACAVYLYNNKSKSSFNYCTFKTNRYRNNMLLNTKNGLPNNAYETHFVTNGGSVNINSSTFDQSASNRSLMYGIKVIDCQANVISNNFYATALDINLMTISKSAPSVVKNNISKDAGTISILSTASNSNIITSNTLTQSIGTSTSGFNRFGIYVRSSMNNSITNNNMQGSFLQMLTLFDIGTANNDISKNIFTNIGSNINVGTGLNAPNYITSNGNHKARIRNVEQGVFFTCNNFKGNYTNIQSAQGGIRFFQGAYNGTSITGAAGNTFSSIPASHPALHLNNVLTTNGVTGGSAYRYFYDGVANTSNLRYPSKVTSSVLRFANNPNGSCFSLSTVPRLSNVVEFTFTPVVGLSSCDKLQLRRFSVADVINLKGERVNLKNILQLKQEEYVNNQNTLSPFQTNQLLSEISVIKGEVDKSTTDLILNMYLNQYNSEEDASQPINNQELIDLYLSYDNPFGDYQITDLKFANKEYSSAFATLSQIPTKYNLTSNQLDAHNDIISYYNILKGVYDDNRTLYETNEIEQNNLKTLADKPMGVAKYRSCSWLSALGVDYCPLPEPAYQYDSESSVNEYLSDIDITLYPTPITSTLNVNFDLPTELVSATFAIYDFMGNEIYNTSVPLGLSNTSINTTGWNNGFYLYVLRDATNKIVYSNTTIK